MGYLKFNKFDGSVDLLPAENIMHVSAPGAGDGDIGIKYGITAESAATPTFLTAVVAGTADGSGDAALTTASRNAINAAIEAANGTNDAVSVNLGSGLFCKSITIGDTDPS